MRRACAWWRSCLSLSSHVNKGEEVVEPEVDLSAFLEKQRLSESARTCAGEEGADADADEIDTSLAHLSSQRQPAPRPQKGRVQTIEWDEALEQMRRDKSAAEANRGACGRVVCLCVSATFDDPPPFSRFARVCGLIDLKERFRAKTGTLRPKPMAPKERKKGPYVMCVCVFVLSLEENDVVEAPPLPVEGAAKKDPKGEMQDFLDDLLG